ncbi:MAG: hypothetical protein IKX86_07035 [Clostridia bacterium]|nr:hypothetical protein [Clostridia bacterium]
MKKLSIIMAVVMIVMTLLAIAATAAAGPATLQPAAGERTLQTIGKTNPMLQKLRITDKGDGTYSIVTGHEAGGTMWYGSFTADLPEMQYTNQDLEGAAEWNYYVPGAYYDAGLVKDATELCWAFFDKSEEDVATSGALDFSDLNDFEVYYSEDGVSWKKAEVQIYRYDPKAVKSNGENEFSPDCGATLGVRFVFKNAISKDTKYFCIYDPSTKYLNIKFWSTWLAAAYTADGSTAWVEGASTEPATDTADYTAAVAIVLAVSALGTALISKKIRK